MLIFIQENALQNIDSHIGHFVFTGFDGLNHDDVNKWKHFPRYWPLWEESTDHRWIPLIKASNAELRCFLLCAPEQTAKQTVEMMVIWDAITLIMTSL